MRRDEWPILVVGGALAVMWTGASTFWLLTAQQRIELKSPLEVLRIVALLPGVISIAVGQSFYESGIPEELGLVVGCAVALAVTCGAALTIARRP